MKTALCVMLLLCVEGLEAKTMTVDKSGVKPGPVSIREANGALLVDWEDDAGHRWEAVFALDSTEPVIASVSMDGRGVVEGGSPGVSLLDGKEDGRVGPVLRSYSAGG